MSLPPELGIIDEAWSLDEQPTIARPSRIPTAPARMEIPSEAPTAPGLDLEAPTFELELDLAPTEAEADIQERVTTVPEIPLDDFARRAMKSDSAAAQATEAPAPRGFSDDVPELDSDIPTQMPNAEAPTVAPDPGATYPTGREMHFPPASNPGVSLQSMGSNMAAPPLSEPRKEPRSAPGRVLSMSPDGKSDAQGMKERFAMGDFSGALSMAEKILRDQPRDDEALSLAKRCREVLIDMYSSRLSGLHRVPRIVMGPDQIRWLSLNHRAGFLLSMIDGISTIDDLLDVSGMQRVDALRILCDLLDQKVIGLE